MISLDFSCVATWARVSRSWLAQALTVCKAALPEALSREPRSDLPSMAMCEGGTAEPKAATHSPKPRWNASGSRREKTERKVSCEGMPLGSRRNDWNQSLWMSPKSSMSVQAN